MPNNGVTEDEIEAAELLSGHGEFARSLAITQEMLKCAQEDETRMRLLFNVINCSSQLNLTDVTDKALQILEQLPNPKESRVFADLLQVMAYIQLGRVQDALHLINANLKSEFMEREDFQVCKYEYLAYKGRSLTYLGKYEEALILLDHAHRMYPEGAREVDILIDQASCMMSLKQYEAAYLTANQVCKWGNAELESLAILYMAESRMGQGMVQESLKLYSDLLERLPCKFVQEDRIKAGIKIGMEYLEKCNPQVKPS